MKILLTNHSLMYVGGTEKWTYTMARALHVAGHDVEVFTFLEGMTSERIKPYAKVVTEVGDGYDLILANHNTCQYQVKDFECPKVFTIHGPKHPMEQPIAGADAYAAVSREVRAKHAGLKPTVITNGVDLMDFRPFKKHSKHALVACKIEGAGEFVGRALEAEGWTFEAIHYTQRPVWDTATMMARAEIVIGCGRTAIEALACGCDVLVLDARNTERSVRTDGWLTEDNIEHLRQVNFSTRAFGRGVSEEGLRDLLQWYEDSTTGEPGWQRGWAEENADIDKKVDEYFALVKGLRHGEAWAGKAA